MGSGFSASKHYKEEITQIRETCKKHPSATDVTSLDEARKELARARKMILNMYDKYSSLNDNDTFQLELNSFISQHGQVADSFWLQHSEACKECIGPIAMSRDLNASSILKAKQALQVNKKLNRSLDISRQKLNITKLAAGKKKLDSEMGVAVKNLANTRVSVASKVSHRLVADISRYSHAMEKNVNQEPEAYSKLNATAAAISNISDLKVGAKVLVVNVGSLSKACVVEVKSNTYKVSLWKIVDYKDGMYEEGYETTESEYLELPRVKLYALNAKPMQQSISDATISLVCGGSDTKEKMTSLIRNSKRPEFLMALYVDARKARLSLQILGAEAQAAIGTHLVAIIPKLKGKERAMVKTQEKYEGDYSRLTDLARMTFECATISTALAILNFIRDHIDWTITRVKNRLDLAYDPSSTGGYRDMLINAVHKDLHHYVEIQITLKCLLTIKKNGGHAVYKLARLLELNEKHTTVFNDAPTRKTVTEIATGLIREIGIKSVPLDPELRDVLFSEQGLLSPSSAVMSLQINSITSLNGWSSARAMSHKLMTHIGANLIKLDFCECGLVGPFPDEIGACCPNLEYLDLCRNTNITGAIPQSFWSLTEMRVVYLENLGLTGSIPEDIGQMKRLQQLYLGNNMFSGSLPQAIGSLKNLLKLSLDGNRFTGPIPSTIGKCTKLQQLTVQDNPLEGRLPVSLAACVNLQLVYCWGTKLDLTGYPPVNGNVGCWDGESVGSLLSFILSSEKPLSNTLTNTHAPRKNP